VSGTEIPRLPRALLGVLLPREIRASAIEDISLAYRRDVSELGPLRARLRLWREVVATNWLALWWDGGDTPLLPRIVEDLRQDLWYGARQLLRSPVFSTGVLITLGIGIGANTAVFGIVRGVLLQPLGYPDDDRLVTVLSEGGDGGRGPASGPDFADWRELTRSFEALAAYAPGPVNLGGDGEPARIVGARVSEDMFRTFGVQAALGRVLIPDDYRPRAQSVVVVSHGFWNRGFVADSAVLGRSVTLNDEPHVVVGVMPEGFNAPVPWARYDVWTALSLQSLAEGRDWRRLHVVGRLRSDADLGSAEEDLQAIAARLADQYPASNHGVTTRVIPLGEAYLGDLRGPLWLLGLAAGAVLLIACVNVAGMLLARAVARQEEVAMRRALGARHGRLVRQFLAESLLVCLVGGAVGIFLARWSLSAFGSLLASALPRSGEIQLDGGVLAFTAMASLGVAVALGLAPMASTGFAGGPLGSDPRPRHGRARARLGKTFVAVQFAMTLLLANGAVLMLRSYLAVTSIELGLDPDGVATLTLTPEGARYEDPRRRQAFFSGVLDGIRSLPGVTAVGATSKLPLEGGSNTKVMIDGREGEFVQAQAPLIELSRVMPGYFETMRIPIVSGRVLEERDFDPHAPGIVINQTMARRLFGAEAPLGQRVSWEIERPHWMTIVGVVGDVRQWGVEEAAVPEMYVPYSVLPRPRMFVVVRGESDPLTLIPSIRRVVTAVDPLLPVSDVRTMDDVRAGAMAGRRFNAALVSLLAGIALVLVTAGIYAVMAQHAARRTKEIGIRMALGADSWDTFRHVVTTGMTPALLGVFLGLGAFLWLAPLLGRFVFGVSATDPFTVATATTFVVLPGLLACFVPARRAARTDPVQSIRGE
jgi:putative ABC transport system permease protein